MGDDGVHFRGNGNYSFEIKQGLFETLKKEDSRWMCFPLGQRVGKRVGKKFDTKVEQTMRRMGKRNLIHR